MRNPSRKAAVFAAAVAFGAAAAWAGVQRHEAVGKDLVSGVMIAAGLATVLVMLALLGRALFHMRGMAKLQAGIGRVTQWHVGAADWDKFRAAEAGRVASNPTLLGNDLWLRKRTPPEGVDVIVGEKSLIVDGSYHVLRLNGVPEMRNIGWLDHSATAGRPPDCLEFLLAYPRGKYGGVQYTCLRVPVPRTAHAQGRRAYAQFAPAIQRRIAKGPIALRNPRRTLQVCGTILVLSLAALAWGWIEAERTAWNSHDTTAPIVLLVGGSVGVIFASLLAGLTLLLRPKKAGISS